MPDDDGIRWRFVLESLQVCNEQQIKAVETACNAWGRLFPDNGPAAMQNVLLQAAKRCGYVGILDTETNEFYTEVPACACRDCFHVKDQRATDKLLAQMNSLPSSFRYEFIKWYFAKWRHDLTLVRDPDGDERTTFLDADGDERNIGELYGAHEEYGEHVYGDGGETCTIHGGNPT